MTRGTAARGRRSEGSRPLQPSHDTRHRGAAEWRRLDRRCAPTRRLHGDNDRSQPEDTLDEPQPRPTHPATVGGAIVYAILFAATGFLLGLAAKRAVTRIVDSADDDLQKGRIRFVGQVARVGVYVVVLVVYAHLIPALRAAGTALLASASVVSIVLGLAAQSTLGNLIAGISIVLYRPFQIGDRLVVTAPGGIETAVVESLTLGHTVLRTYDNRRVVVPNSVMIGQTIVNLSSEDLRVQAIVPVSIAYSADIAEARRLLVEMAEQHPGIESVDSCPVTSLDASSATLQLRAWAADSAAASVAQHDLFESVLGTFRRNGIEISFPTMNVNVVGTA